VDALLAAMHASGMREEQERLQTRLQAHAQLAKADTGGLRAQHGTLALVES